MKLSKRSFWAGLAILSAGYLGASTSAVAGVRGWLNWRGPQQNGTSTEKNLPDKIEAKKPLWMNNYRGASTPVIADGKVVVETKTKIEREHADDSKSKGKTEVKGDLNGAPLPFLEVTSVKMLRASCNVS